MQCAEFEARVHNVLDQRAAPDSDAELVEHASNCERCAQIMHAQRSLFDGLRSPIEQATSVHFGHQVLDALKVEKANRVRRRSIAFGLATAAALMVMVMSFARGPRVENADRDSAGGRLAIATPPRSVTPSPAMSPEEKEEFRLLIRQLLDQVSTHPVQGLDTVDEVAAKSLRPLAVSFNFALDSLRRHLPGQNNDESTDPQARLFEYHVDDRLS